jgi:hypothetical protein
MMALSTDDVIKIMEAGGGLVLDAGTLSKEDLHRIAPIAAQREVMVHLKNAKDMDVDDLVELSQASDGYFIFEL